MRQPQVSEVVGEQCEARAKRRVRRVTHRTPQREQGASEGGEGVGPADGQLLGGKQEFEGRKAGCKQRKGVKGQEQRGEGSQAMGRNTCELSWVARHD